MIIENIRGDFILTDEMKAKALELDEGEIFLVWSEDNIIYLQTDIGTRTYIWQSSDFDYEQGSWRKISRNVEFTCI